MRREDAARSATPTVRPAGLARALMTLRGEHGASVVEELIAVTLVAVVVLSALLGLSTLTVGSAGQRDRVTAEALAVAQVEAIKSAPYATSYPTVTMPPGFTVAIAGPSALSVPGVQRLTVTISQGGRPLRSLTVLKSSR